MRRTALAFAAALALAAAPALAEPTRAEIAVSSAGLDLSSPPDAALMAQRIDAAARQACGGSPRFWTEYRLARAWTVEQFNSCRGRAEADALAALNAPLVTASVSRTAAAGAR